MQGYLRVVLVAVDLSALHTRGDSDDASPAGDEKLRGPLLIQNLKMISTETEKEKNYSAMVAATRDWVYYLKLHEAGRLRGLASHTDTNGAIAPCCAATRASLSASAVCMRSCTGLAGVLAFFSQNVRWGALVAVHYCEAWERRKRLECNSASRLALWMASLTNEVASGQVALFSVRVLLCVSTEQTLRWKTAFENEPLGVGVGWIHNDAPVVYHEVIGLCATSSYALKVYDQSEHNWMHPCNSAIDDEGSILAWHVSPLSKSSPKFVTFGGFTVPVDSWFTFHPSVSNHDIVLIQQNIKPIPTTLLPLRQLVEFNLTSSQPAVTVFVAGVACNSDNPSPGLGVGRSLRKAFGPQVRLIAVDFSFESGGLGDALWDDRIVISNFNTALPGSTASMVGRMLKFYGPNSFYVSTLDLDISVLAHDVALLGEKQTDCRSQEVTELLELFRSRVLIPGPSSLSNTCKPEISACHELGLKVSPWTRPFREGCEGNEGWGTGSELHEWCLSVGYPVAVKGSHFDCMFARTQQEVADAIKNLSALWGQRSGVFLQQVQTGEEGSLALVANKGELLAVVQMKKHITTSLKKVWGAEITIINPDDAPWGPIARVVKQLNWTGGAEIEFVESLHGTRWCIDWNPRFPAWVYGSTVACGEQGNLPAMLLEHAAQSSLGVSLTRYDAGVDDSLHCSGCESESKSKSNSSEGPNKSNNAAKGLFMRTIIEQHVVGVHLPCTAGPECSPAICASNSGGGKSGGVGGGGVNSMRPHPSRNTEMSYTLLRWAKKLEQEKQKQRLDSSLDAGTDLGSPIDSDKKSVSCSSSKLQEALSLVGVPHPDDQSPRLVLLAPVLRAQLNIVLSVVQAASVDTSLNSGAAISIKTNPHFAVLSAAREMGLLAEAISLGEVRAALQAGFPPEDILLNGPAKWLDFQPLSCSNTDGVSALASEMMVGTGARVNNTNTNTNTTRKLHLRALIVDSCHELEELVLRMAAGDALNDPMGRPLSFQSSLHVTGADYIALRLAPPTTGSRFGLDAGAPEMLQRAALALAKLPVSQAHGYHMHFPQSQLGTAKWASEAESILIVAAQIDALSGRRATFMDFGGGFSSGACATPHLGEELGRLFRLRIPALLPSVSFVLVEPGKIISERAGLLLTRVLTVREPSARSRHDLEELDKMDRDTEEPGQCAIVDACIGELGDYNSRTHPVAHLPRNATSSKEWKVLTSGAASNGSIYGRICMESDLIARSVELPRTLSPGDWIAVAMVGAYDTSMSYRFGTGSLSSVFSGGIELK